MKEISYIAVSGYFSSGSSAVVDLLKEYENVFECDAEIRLIKDPYGISELERALTTNWELLNSAAAIRDFLWLCFICNRKSTTPFSKAGLSYCTKLTPDFMKLTKEYIEELSEYEYKSDFYYQKFKKKYLRYVIDRIRMGIEFYTNGRLRTANRKVPSAYFANPSKEKFEGATKKYLNSLFGQCITSDCEKGYVILDQAISTNDTDAIHRYFDDARLIIVDRDPRDMYVEDLVRWRENLDNDVSSAEAGRRYVLRHKALRQSIPESDSAVYNIKFENLVLQYEKTVSDIEAFLGFDARTHMSKKKYLIPEKSAKNIGVWKKYYDVYKDALDVISMELGEYCYRD